MVAAALRCVLSPAAAEEAAPGHPLPAPAGQVETVRFADPRWPAVQVVRGPVAPAAQAAPVQVLRGASVRVLRGPSGSSPAGAPGMAPPQFSANAANTEIVTFGDGTGNSVQVVRGSGPPVPRPAARNAVGGVETVRFGGADVPSVNVVRGSGTPLGAGVALFDLANGGELDRVAFAVDGAESGHGRTLAMWRPDLDGPQGPMQVSAAAALDVGGGDRFDMRENRLIGRAFLARLYQRYGNWPDAIAAYNWGPANVDRWIAAGRPVDRLPLETARYLLKVLRDALLLGPS